MTQLSRPFQILLAATVLFAVVWFVALAPHGQSSSSTPVASTPVSAPAPAATSHGAAAASSTKVYHGAAPGVEGLTRDIQRAHGAVAASQSQAQQAAGATGEPSGKGSGVVSSSTTVSKSKPAGASGSAAQASKSKTTVVHPKHAAVPAGTVTKSSVTVTGTKRGAPGSSVTVTKTVVHAAPVQQVAVEKQLKQGKVVLVLFWNPKGSDDVSVHKELGAVEKNLGKKIAVHYALADQVGSFGSITKAIQVNQTPTILMVNSKGLTTTLTGFTDAFAIEQTIKEARQA
jgi:hypothetical protein